MAALVLPLAAGMDAPITAAAPAQVSAPVDQYYASPPSSFFFNKSIFSSAGKTRYLKFHLRTHLQLYYVFKGQSAKLHQPYPFLFFSLSSPPPSSSPSLLHRKRRDAALPILWRRRGEVRPCPSSDGNTTWWPTWHDLASTPAAAW
jgi:hypothetical protein